jgi:transcriptional regulator of acetoin/glycerol metabolism
MNRYSDQGLGDTGGSLFVPSAPQAGASPAGMLAMEDRTAMIESSRRRSAAYGLTENAQPDFSLARRPDFSMLLDQNHALCAYALPVMDTLHEQIVNTHSMVVLTDANGLVLHAVGDDDFLEKADKVAIKPGANWSEQSKGTNAIGTAIAERMPTLVHGDEHYLHANHVLTCSAAPIFDYQGNIIGVLDVTGDYRGYHKHTLALVRMSAQMIENQLFSAAFQNAATLHFHSRPELIGTLMEAIASFTPGGRFLSANRAALSQLGLPLAALHSHTFSSLFGMPLSALFDHHRSAAPEFLNLCLHNGLRVAARAELRLDAKLFAHTDAPAQEKAAAQSRPSRMARRTTSLRALNTGDPKIADALEKVSKVLGRGIPLLVTGETGTGKDLLAQAIHHDSPHASGPFVAVNCASIPETLIESELFGYEDGAFTGARKNGSIGKILQANGGTLFLDEIGDMPLQLQARLLRVLQEQVVTPLGSSKSIPANFALICATNRNLRDLIAQRAFREDLYYRLNGLTIKLPPLRERSDIDVLTKKLLAAESNGPRYTVSPEALVLFKRHHWPGNIRQLANLLRTASAMAGDDREIRKEHLPDDFLEEVASVSTDAATPSSDSMPLIGAKLGDVEISIIRKTLEAHNGNVSAAARVLGISRNTIYRRLQT